MSREQDCVCFSETTQEQDCVYKTPHMSREQDSNPVVTQEQDCVCKTTHIAVLVQFCIAVLV
jgi:hypothetical protein